MGFLNVLEHYRKVAFSERDKGTRFERLMQLYLQTDPKYAYNFKHVWMWDEFPSRKEFGGKDTGIDLVALTHEGEYWAIQCKCFQEGGRIDKAAVDSFLSTSGRTFELEDKKKIGFSNRLWISTTNLWGLNAEETIKNQTVPIQRLSLYDLENAPVDWEKLENGLHGEQARSKKHNLKSHQLKALEDTHEYFKTQTRGKLIMACGTGKTYTSLKIAENETNGNGLVLFLVPSIALLGQTLNEWTAQANEPINAICICSDSGVSQKKKQNDDSDGYSVIDLALPASTNVSKIVKQFHNIMEGNKPGMTVVFSTYQSIEVIAEAQLALLESQDSKKPYGIFDLIICDEAHRTTGVTIADTDESAFVKVHNNTFIQAKKRLYMTATPRLFDDNSKSKAAQNDAILCSMDDADLYGEEIYRIGFGEAVENGLLSDYKVLVLTLSENDIPAALQQAIADDSSEINTDDASKLIGCINALSKQVLGDEGIIKDTDPEPMRRAVAFCANIKDSKQITKIFNETGKIYADSLPPETRDELVYLNSQHVDGTMSAPIRDEMLSWLKATPEDSKECRVLTNARCLSEGVDVPSLDAVLFLSARNSQVDVVQSVGRVMRKAEGKKYGYIIIPIIVPTNVEADKALDDNKRYAVVWTVLNALRAHDDRFNALVNKLELNKKKPGQIIVGRPASTPHDDRADDNLTPEFAQQLSLEFEELQSAVFARMVIKVGDRRYWELWAKDVAKIAERYIDKITNLVKQDGEHKEVFANFVKGLHKNINPSITDKDAIEMLSQHIITKPVFEALFEGYSFVKNNPISISMQSMVDLLEAQSLEKDADTLQRFYESVKKRAAGIDNAEGKQKIIIELYDKFFKSAFPKMVEQLGIVYTPVECVDFIIYSVNDILQKEFGRSISDENIHLLDPFTGTGTFITRLIQSGLISQEDLERKYKHEIHANEIVLLAYYIASINIENAFHDATLDPNDGIGKDKYIPFDGICLTDTFQLGETQASERLFSEMFPQNSDRVEKQKKAPLRIIFGNPPYSIGQKSANDNAQNQSYPKLDAKIAATYAAASSAGLNKSLYDAYIKAFRWSSDRLDQNGGIISFISNGAWLDGNSTDGFRKCLEKEFTSIYIFNLRGNARTSGELRQKEGGGVFGLGSRTPITITLLVKNPASENKSARIYYHDIGDYLSQQEKLAIIKSYHSVGDEKMGFVELIPNEHGDWLSQRNDLFSTYLPITPEKKFDNKTNSYFLANIVGVATGRDAWVLNFSKQNLSDNMQSMIDFYNDQCSKFVATKHISPDLNIEDFIDTNANKISWTVNLKNDISKFKNHIFENNVTKICLYRPFTKSMLYYSKNFIERPGLWNQVFPTDKHKNLVISCINVGSSKEFSVVISDCISEYQLVFANQSFPLHYYEERKVDQTTLFAEDGDDKYIRRDGISDFILERAHKQYGDNVTKEDIFYYVYGFLHSPEYRETFANDLKKMLPRLPLLDDVKDFWAFSKAGRRLADLHIKYETIEPYNGVNVIGEESQFYKVDKMRYPKKDQKDTIIYNSKITVENIPAKAYEYVVNGKSAIDWIMERYQVTIHKESQIKNDPNDWATEVDNPRYILDLLLSIINVSVQTVDIVQGLPKVKFDS
jgi:predicted helicase